MAEQQEFGDVVIGGSDRGGTPTVIKAVRGYRPTLTPALIVAIGIIEHTFNVPGLTTDDTVTVNGPAQPAGLALVHARVSAADTLALQWNTLGINLTPTSGNYRILAIRH